MKTTHHLENLTDYLHAINPTRSEHDPVPILESNLKITESLGERTVTLSDPKDNFIMSVPLPELLRDVFARPGITVLELDELNHWN